MNRKAFWDAIRATHSPGSDAETHLDSLYDYLLAQKPKDIAAFQKQVLDLKSDAFDARLLEVLWILTGGGPDDDGLDDFTNWLILTGKKSFDAILESPEQFPERFPPGTEIYVGGLTNVVRAAYEESTGRDDFDEFFEQCHGTFRQPNIPKGADHDPRTEDKHVLEKRLREKYPELWNYAAQYD